MSDYVNFHISENLTTRHKKTKLVDECRKLPLYTKNHHWIP